jgi:methylenetetrahydrofolate dehydrogenase (NADP+)/methenyltetrahydrofolate cyclohydrolase
VTARILDGKALAARVRAEVATRAAALRALGQTPGLAVILVGDDPASAVYVRSKTKAAREANVDVYDHKLPATVSQAELMALIARLNDDPAVDGILLQLPLPAGLDSNRAIESIRADKDVDGLHPESLGRLAQGRPSFVSCTPKGCLKLLAEGNVELRGARAVVLGRSLLVGKPVAYLLTNADATVTILHSRSRDLEAQVAAADIVIAAIGRAELVRGSWIKPGAAVIDVGMNRTEAGKLIGDVEYGAAAERASVITPVPGGVGPMTIACLLENTVESRERRVAR